MLFVVKVAKRTNDTVKRAKLPTRIQAFAVNEYAIVSESGNPFHGFKEIGVGFCRLEAFGKQLD